MKSVIILDKSVLHNLSAAELALLGERYYLNIPPVLLAEVLGDLKKKPRRPHSRPEDIVSGFAKSLGNVQHSVNLHHRILCSLSLLGHQVLQGGHVIIDGRYDKKRKVIMDGVEGTIVVHHPQETALSQWQRSAFLDEEGDWAAIWRADSPNIDVNAYRSRMVKGNIIVPQCTNLSRLAASVERLLLEVCLQRFFFDWLMSEISFKPLAVERIERRWSNRRSVYLKDFAPYAFYWLRVNVIFACGILNGTISTSRKKKSKVDIEYCYYLPFSTVFSSSDKLHIDLAPSLLGRNQSFIEGTIFKEILTRDSHPEHLP